MSYLIRVILSGSEYSEVELHPEHGNSWNVVNDPTLRKRWPWAVIGRFSSISNAFKFTSTDGEIVFTLLKFSNPPALGASGRATLGPEPYSLPTNGR
jgi:hypothetical protein